MSNYSVPLESERFYHIYNRTNNKEALFRDNGDRMLFLQKYKEYLLSYVNTYVYCLMGTHFHFLIQVKSIEAITKMLNNMELKDLMIAQREFLETEEDLRITPKLIASQFTRLFTSYAMKYNQKYSRSGNLFYRPFKRVEVFNQTHFAYLIY